MVKSFEQLLKQEKSELTESLILFSEGNRLNKALANLEMNRPELYKFYEAGRQSKQAEVNELQKRIDESMKMLAHGEGYGYEQCTRLAINILKGNANEH